MTRELTAEQIRCCDLLAERGGRVDDEEIRRLCAMAQRYLTLRKAIEDRKTRHDVGGLVCRCFECKALLRMLEGAADARPD